MLQRQGDFITVYFPPDGNSTLACLEEMLSSRDTINVLAAGKTLEPRWLTVDEARMQIKSGFSIWKFASDENPDIVFCSLGDYVTKEMLAAISILKREIPSLKIRYVNGVKLESSGFSKLCQMEGEGGFNSLFTHDKPVIFNFHGYPQTIKQLLFDCAQDTSRFRVNGYVENGSTTTTFDMQIRNGTSRYDLVIQAIERLPDEVAIAERRDAVIRKYRTKISEHREYIIRNGVDPDEIEQWTWQA